MFADTPGEEEGAGFFGRWLALGDDLEFGFGDATAVGVLNEKAAGDLLEDSRRLRRGDFDQSQVFLGCEAFERVGREGWGDDGFDESSRSPLRLRRRPRG